ncbi:MAG: hypothetical protein WCG21_09865 [Eubacteriales bacterium]
MTDEVSSDTCSTEKTNDPITGEQSPESITISPDTLPKDTVHCYPARKSLIFRRRICSVILGLGFIALTVYFLLPESRSFGLAGFSAAGVIICLLVFIQSVLIASYRVALDYGKKEVVLRYQFQKIRIPFDDFDTREGKPDRAQELMPLLNMKAVKEVVRYLILDNVRDSACYQTTSKDLSGPADFDQLKMEAENVRDVYRGKPDAPKEPELEEDEMTRIINSARTDKPKNID